MPEGSVEDEDDIFVESLINILFLFLGTLAVSVSVILLVHSATVAVYSQQLPMDFLPTSFFAALLFVIGFGSLHIFRKKRRARKRKITALFLRSKA